VTAATVAYAADPHAAGAPARDGAFVEPWELRARFARSLSAMYGREVPAYTTLVEVAREVNDAVVAAQGARAERLGSLDRVTAERHGAIRLGTPRELAQVARVFGAMGMFPVGFYDLREAAPSPVPVVSTAFRPVAAHELARNPFRVFTSLLAVSDRRFFSADLQARLERFLAQRVLFSPELLALADRAEAAGGLPAAEAKRFVVLATRSFELSREPIDEAWYRALERVSAVAADVGGVGSTHINHLTPRVLDIDELYARMQARGIAMIDAVQGPPRWDGPDVLLRQTSFRALAEPRAFRRADGSLHRASLRVRFGEVEARGIALTAAGRALYDELTAEVAAAQAAARAADRAAIAARCWKQRFPDSERGLIAADLSFFEYRLVADRRPDGVGPPADVAALLDGGWVTAQPIVYEDFLPASAAGIFQSNLGDRGSHDAAGPAAQLDAGWMAGALGRELADPISLYAAQRERSLAAVRRALAPDAHLSRS
jgi:uncharacterized glyoxalase superfamily metalloenzyme YdcJ